MINSNMNNYNCLFILVFFISRFCKMSYPGRPPIVQGLPMPPAMAYMPMPGPPPPMMPAVMPLQHVSITSFLFLNVWDIIFIHILPDGTYGYYGTTDSCFSQVKSQS